MKLPSHTRSFIAWRAAPATALAIALWLASAAAHAQVGSIIQVTTTADTIAGDGVCSLREAILASNSNIDFDVTALSCRGTGIDSIRFALGSGNPQININTPLPAITDRVTISGATGGATRVVLRGPGGLPDTFQPGLVVSSATASNTTIRSLVIASFRGDGIKIESASNVAVRGCFIGTNATGTAALSNGLNGITTINAAGTVIGGTTGTVPGGACAGDCNLISGNGGWGVSIFSNANNSFIQGNFIGMNASGTGPIPNGGGISIVTSNQVTVGGSTASARNLVSGNTTDGIAVNGTGHIVQGNYVGIDTTGTEAIPNQASGIQLSDPIGATIGGGAPGEGNVVSGNGLDGIRLQSARTTSIVGNFIGTAADGLTPLGNGAHGVHTVPGANYDGNVVGLGASGQNVIAFNGGDGIRMEGFLAVHGNSIHDNAGAGISTTLGFAAPLPPVVNNTDFPLEGTACNFCRVDIYSDDADEGRIFNGSAIAEALTWSYSGPLAGPNVTLTATTTTPFNQQAVTSVFSAPFPCADFDDDQICDTNDDSDADGVSDATDNCILVANGPTIPDAGGNSQRDSDADDYGNICDADFNNSGLTTSVDFNILRGVLNSAAGSVAFSAEADMNGSGIVTVLDYNLLRNYLNEPPGPSGLVP